MPSNSPRVAAVGCGAWGRNLVRNFHELGALAAIHDEDPKALADAVKQTGCAARDFAAILRSPDIDAVVLATPVEMHASMAQACFEAGKHVFVEKPLALTLADGEKVVALAESKGLTLMVGHLLQYHPAFIRLKQLIAEGRLGRLQYLYSNRLNLGKVRREENTWWSFAPHDISMILSLVTGAPEKVSAHGGAYLHKTLHDVTMTHIDFATGEQAHIFVSWLHPFKEQKLVVVGDKGMAVFNDSLPAAEKLVIYGHHVDWVNGMPVPTRADAEPQAIEAGEPLRLECQHFLDCIAKGIKPRTDGREALRVLSILQAAQQSIETGVKVKLAAKTSNVAKLGGKRPPYIHETACVDQPSEIGAGTKIWHFSHILPEVSIGENCVIGQNCMIGPDVTLGDGCKIQNNVSLYKGVELEEGVFCGPSCVFTNVVNPRAEYPRMDEMKSTKVGRGATIGANATIVCGVTLGRYCLIAAGAVVTKDVPPFALMAGVPARRMGWVSQAGETLGPDLVCPRTGDKYKLNDDGQLEPFATNAARAARA